MNQPAVLRVLLVVLLAFYPFIIYFGIRVLPASFFGIALAVLLLLRFVFTQPGERTTAVPALLLLLAYAVAAAVVGSTQMLMYYPVIINFLMCALFAGSLRHEEPLLLRLVRARGMPMSVHAPRYLTRLTAVWAGFFALNGLIALWTTTQSMELWTIYNGMLAYVLIAALISGEWIFRRHYKRRMGVSDE